MGVGRTARTQQHKRFCADVLNTVLGSRLDADGIPHKHFKVLIAQMHEAMALSNVIKLFRNQMLVTKCFTANGDGRLGKALVLLP